MFSKTFYGDVFDNATFRSSGVSDSGVSAEGADSEFQTHKGTRKRLFKLRSYFA